jgi:hypothetical protein
MIVFLEVFVKHLRSLACAKTDFSVLLGTTGELRGVPVQINYQPNWWFQIVLNLKLRK